MEHQQATGRAGPSTLPRMAGYQDELAGIRAVRGRAVDALRDSPDLPWASGTARNAGHDEPS
jgi:hypothetical protein